VRSLRSLLVATAIVYAGAGCWGHRKASSVEPAAPATLRVENRHWLDVDVYVVQSGHRSRLGTVTATSATSFVFPRSLVLQQAPIQLLAAPIGAPRSLVTETIVVRAGTRVDWLLESNLSTSTLSVY
jgi:hypothetical protein